MAFKVASLIALVVTVAGELHPPSFYQDSLTYRATEGCHDVQNGYSFARVDGSPGADDSVNEFNAVIHTERSPVIYNPPSFVKVGGSPWNYLIPIQNSGSSADTTYPQPTQVLPLAAPWSCDILTGYLTSTTSTTNKKRPAELPFGYVPAVAKISVPPGYKIH